MRRNELLDLTFLKFAGVKISGGQVELLATSLDLPIDAIDRFAQWGRRLRKEGGACGATQIEVLAITSKPKFGGVRSTASPDHRHQQN